MASDLAAVELRLADYRHFSLAYVYTDDYYLLLCSFYSEADLTFIMYPRMNFSF